MSSISWNIHNNFVIQSEKKYKKLGKKMAWDQNSKIGFLMEYESKWFFNSALSNKIKISHCIYLDQIFSKYDQYKWDAINKVDCFVIDFEKNKFPLNIKTCVSPKIDGKYKYNLLKDYIFLTKKDNNFFQRFNSLVPNFLAFFRKYKNNIFFEGFMYNNILENIKNEFEYCGYFGIKKDKFIGKTLEEANKKALHFMNEKKIYLTNLSQIKDIL